MPHDITVRLGHTTDPMGPPSGGSQTAPSIAPVIRDAGHKAKKKLLEAVAGKLGGDAAKMDLKGGQVVGAPKPLTFQQACALIPGGVLDVKGEGQRAQYTLPSYTREVAGAQFAEVEVDTWTGRVRVVKVVAVHDCGVVANTLTTRSQIMGGVIQGLSYALFEDRLMDPRTGNMVNADFVGYKVLGAADMPEIVSIPFSVQNGKTTAGVSSLGEPVTVPTAGAIGNAVANAIGARVRSLPITPDKVLAALGEI